MRIRASVAAVIVVAVVAAFSAHDRPGTPRPSQSGAVLDEMRRLAILLHTPESATHPSRVVQSSSRMRLLADLGWRLADDPAMPIDNPNDPFARPRQ
jgi:hypothetical protein